MHHEFEDYRNKKPYTPPSWYDWQPENPFRYLMVIVAFLIGIPYLFGYMLTPFGCLMQLLFWDWYMYIREHSKYINKSGSIIH